MTRTNQAKSPRPHHPPPLLFPCVSSFSPLYKRLLFLISNEILHRKKNKPTKKPPPALENTSATREVLRPPQAAGEAVSPGELREVVTPMSDPHAPSFPLARGPHAPPPLYKQRSWSPDACREEAWLRRKNNSGMRRKSRHQLQQRSKSVTDEDLDELKACIELGFGFDSPEPADHRLSDTLPALELYYAVNKHYNDSLNPSKPAVNTTSSSSAATSDCESSSPLGSPHTMFDPGDTPQTVKTRLRQWAQVVACSVRQGSS